GTRHFAPSLNLMKNHRHREDHDRFCHGITFHTYAERNKRILKKTHWFRMRTEEKILTPQAEEDIEEAVWMSEEQVRTRVFTDTYRSVSDLLEKYYSEN
ncbi:MAG: hypothetical protein ACKOA1_10780, partial [Bacteroidota bacterium]